MKILFLLFVLIILNSVFYWIAPNVNWLARGVFIGVACSIGTLMSEVWK